jgi:hypothetical protein
MFNKSPIPKSFLIFVITVFVVALVVLAIPKQKPPVIQPTPTPTVVVTASPEPTLTVLPTPTPSINISDWKTYRNDSDGFEIKYPNNPEWIAEADQIKNPEAIKPVKSIINFNPKDKVYYSEGGKISPITITVINGSLENYYKVYAKPTNTIEEKVFINNLSFMRDTDKLWGITTYKIEHPKKKISFMITSYITVVEKENQEETLFLENIYSQMLSTFKFIN